MIIFIDGVCGLCDRLARFVAKRNFHKTFSFELLQGEVAKQRLDEGLRDSLGTVILCDGQTVFVKSEAVITILSRLTLGCRIVAFFLRLFPRFLCDFVYDMVAKYRYLIWGKKDSCGL
ncbi:MAG: DUF393 domain-containing protein [Candidatus Margulisbacteria bacterium]|nr:DUF393 domain-containing protein [Candidatus Margulisiibacteriota bacterium]